MTKERRDDELEALLEASGFRDASPSAEERARWERAVQKENRRLFAERPTWRVWAIELSKVAAIALVAFWGGARWDRSREAGVRETERFAFRQSDEAVSTAAAVRPQALAPSADGRKARGFAARVPADDDATSEYVYTRLDD